MSSDQSSRDGSQSAATSSSNDLINSLQARIDEVLCSVIPAKSRVALLDFPNYSNVGDSAIWLGEIRWLQKRGCEIVYVCDVETYHPEALRRQVGDGIILLNGGGNLGDFWIHHQRFREWVISEFHQNRIVQLPQTIYFIDEWDMAEAGRVFSAHPDLTVLCRDLPSLEFANARFSGRNELCPDMAFSIGSIGRTAAPDVDVFWLGRTDAESTGAALPELGEGVVRADWLEEPPTTLSEKVSERRHQIMEQKPVEGAELQELAVLYDQLAAERVERGCRLLQRGRVVITDRLHGHIMSTLLGLPHVLLDNSYGKVKRFYELWTRSSALTHVASTPEEALRLAGEMVIRE